jgi:acyl carrier protein
MVSTADVRGKVREFIAREIFRGNIDSELTDKTALISGGIMDSISTIQLVDFLEKEYDIQFRPHEVDQDNLDTIELIAVCVESKIKEK